MKATHTQFGESADRPLDNSWSVSEIGVVAFLTALMPYLIHLIPSWDDSPIGAKLLPLFYAPLFAAFNKHYRISLVIAFLSPWINHLVFGNPPFGLALILWVELSVFSILIYLAVRFGLRQTWIAPIAYLLCKPFSALVLFIAPSLLPVPNPLIFVASSVTNAWPGIILLALMAWVAKKLHSHS